MAFSAAIRICECRDKLDSLVEDRDLTHLFLKRGQPAERPWRLALITIFQFVKDLSNHQAPDSAVLVLIGKSAPSRPRQYWIRSHCAERFAGWWWCRGVLLDLMLKRFRCSVFSTHRPCQRTDFSYVLAVIQHEIASTTPGGQTALGGDRSRVYALLRSGNLVRVGLRLRRRARSGSHGALQSGAVAGGRRVHGGPFCYKTLGP